MERLKLIDLKLRQEKYVLLALFVVILLGIFLRFHNFTQRISYDADMNRDIFVAVYGAKHFQLPLTGPFTSISSVTTGPWYWWLLILVRALFPQPLSLWLFVGALSILLIPLNYLIGRKIGSPMFGLVLAFVCALSLQQTGNASFLTNPSLIGFLSCLSVYLYLQMIQKQKNFLIPYVFGFVVGLTITIHYQALPIILLFLYPLSQRRFSEFGKVIIGFGITLLPLLFFELTNHWHNLTYILDYYRFGQYRIYVPNRWITYATQFWPSYWSFATSGNLILSYVVMICGLPLFYLSVFKNYKNKLALLFLLIPFFVGLIMLRYYRGEKFFGYLQFFHPYIFLLTGSVIYGLIRNKYVLVFGLIIVFSYSYFAVNNIFKTNLPDNNTKRINELYRDVLSKWGDKKYTLYYCPGTERDLGKGFAAKMILEDKVAFNSESKLLYLFGDCKPIKVSNDLVKYEKNKLNYQKLQTLQHIENIYLVSDFSDEDLKGLNSYVMSEDREYQDIARWYFNEQP